MIRVQNITRVSYGKIHIADNDRVLCGKQPKVWAATEFAVNCKYCLSKVMKRFDRHPVMAVTVFPGTDGRY